MILIKRPVVLVWKNGWEEEKLSLISAETDKMKEKDDGAEVKRKLYEDSVLEQGLRGTGKRFKWRK